MANKKYDVGGDNLEFDIVLAEILNKTVPLEKVDRRLRTNSALIPLKTRTSKSSFRTPRVCSMPPPVHVNLRRQKVPLSDQLLRLLSEALDGEDEEMKKEPSLDDKETLNLDTELQPESDQEEEIPGTSSGSKYTLEQAKGQLDGIIRQWMDLAGRLPEGEQRHRFIELGERLREISGVFHRDFIEKAGGMVSA